MKTFGVLKNRIQEYAWGSHTAIADLIGLPEASDTPQAELWMGAHPKAPSQVKIQGCWISLIELIDRYPTEILGHRVVDRFANSLPFLFKVLAAQQPLSIQAHPDLNRARKGFKRETRQGIPMDAPERNYRDANHKPECICALTPFWALNGFRSRTDMVRRLRHVCPDELQVELDLLSATNNSRGLKRFFEILMHLPAHRKIRIIEETIRNASRHEDPIYRWMVKLNRFYPDDIGILSPGFLNLIRLAPGEALFLQPGELHAYLEGLGIELMANSDNVLRGGLTAKHVDVPELLTALSFKEGFSNVLHPERIGKSERVYSTPAAEFSLSVIALNPGMPYHSARDRSVEILLCTDGCATLIDTADNSRIDLRRGMSVIVPAALEAYGVEGHATLYKASVPAFE